MSLREYVRKRDFEKTAEPRGKRKPGKRSRLHFVVQKHAARRLHYDFRLELAGTLKSWAVPKGIPTAKGERRLAVQVEDHPLEYADFEGVIPAGQYGGGTVMVWDRGDYEPLSEHPLRDLEHGKLHFVLHGGKLNGEWALVHIKADEENQWLMMKIGVSAKPVSKKRDDESGLSGRTMEKIAADADAVWQSGSGKSEPLEFVEPMKARFVEEPPRHGDWIYELKFDGYRAIALKDGAGVQLFSRNANDLSKRFPDIAKAVASLPADRAILDGEIVALDAKGRSSFQLLQALEMGTERPPVVYYLFDVLHEDGRSLEAEALSFRKASLKKICKGAGDPIRYSDGIGGDPRKLLEEVKKHGLEGIIGKRSDSHYEPGRRSGAWIKLKAVNEQEFVIGGFTRPGGTREYFGALLIGYFEKKDLRFAGKVGTGFDTKALARLHKKLIALKSESCPFVMPDVEDAMSEQKLTAAEMRRCTWVEPRLVCQIKFAEWTRGGRLRQPVFLGLRDDKEASQVVRER